MKRLLTLSVLLFVCLAVAAQEKPKKAAAPKPAAQGGAMPMPKPSPEMKKLLASFRGTWTGTMTTEPVMGMPAGTSSGPARFYPGPG